MLIGFSSELQLQSLQLSMAPRKIDDVASKRETSKNLGVRVEARRVKGEMGKIKKDQIWLKDEQRKLTTRLDDISKQCDELKEETEVIVKQAAMTRIKLVLMFRILKARESGDFIEAADLTRFLREIVAMEKGNAILAQLKDDDNDDVP